mmetsp:Transcript_1489/g.3460  ORF Transcript_1489/g.3460 Transcript_1489/m.3460 type:complete len:167 (-) Transcript_1489:339-839(-)
MMGWFATAGSVGSIALPLLGTLLESRQPSSSFSLNLLLLCASYAGLLLLRGSIHRCTTDRPAGAEVLSPLHTHHTADAELSQLSVDEKPDEKGSSDCAGAVGADVGVVGADGGGRQWAVARSLVWPAVQLTMATALGCFALVSLLFCGCWTAAQCVHIVNPFTALA